MVEYAVFIQEPTDKLGDGDANLCNGRNSKAQAIGPFVFGGGSSSTILEHIE